MQKGDRIETTGEGRTARWPHQEGVVVRVWKKSIVVVWDGTHFEDEMDLNEVRAIGEVRS